MAWAVIAVAGAGPLVAIVPAVAAGVIVGALLWLKAPELALGALRAVPLPEGEHPRMINLVDGLCTTHGFNRPVLWVAGIDSIDGAAVGLRRSPGHLVVTRATLSELDRLELEALVTRLLCELRSGASVVTVLAAAARIPLTGHMALRQGGRIRSIDNLVAADLETVCLTNYPPALASALQRSHAGAAADTPAAVAHLWLLAPCRATAAALMPQRIAVLGEV